MTTIQDRVCLAMLAPALMWGPGAVLASGQTVMLKPSWNPAESLYIEVEVESNTTLVGGMFGDGSISNQRQVFGWIVKPGAEQTGGGRTLAMTFDRVGQRYGSKIGTWGFDSDVPDPAAESNSRTARWVQQLKPMLGETITMTVGKTGRATACRGLGALFDKVAKTAGPRSDVDTMRRQYSEPWCIAMWHDVIFLPFPHREVKLGDKWERTLHEPSSRTGELIRHYAFEVRSIALDRARPVVILGYTMTVRRADNAVSTPNRVGKKVTQYSGQLKGLAYFDVNLGMFVKSIASGQIIEKANTPNRDTGAVQESTATKYVTRTYTISTLEDRKKNKGG